MATSKIQNSGSIFTFGYGNRVDYEALDCYISKHSIQILVDIRLSPKAWSRKWWGDQLEKYCVSKGISYISENRLGNTSGKKEWIPPDKKKAEEALEKVSTLVKTTNVLLLCAELDWQRCHRTVVAEIISSELGKPVYHLK